MQAAERCKLADEKQDDQEEGSRAVALVHCRTLSDSQPVSEDQSFRSPLPSGNQTWSCTTLEEGKPRTDNLFSVPWLQARATGRLPCNGRTRNVVKLTFLPWLVVATRVQLLQLCSRCQKTKDAGKLHQPTVEASRNQQVVDAI